MQAEVDAKHLRRAVNGLMAELEKAKAAQEADATRQRIARAEALQIERAAILANADRKFEEFAALMQQAEAKAVELHATCGGARNTLTGINDRHGALVAWTLTKFVEALPITETLIGSVGTRLGDGAAKYRGMALTDCQPDYAAEFAREMSPRLETDDAETAH
jgi:acetyl-CoA carboxylase carboxyltransferase component